MYLDANFSLSWTKHVAGSDAYVSDPAEPVPMLPRPIGPDGDQWRTWLVQD